MIEDEFVVLQEGRERVVADELVPMLAARLRHVTAGGAAFSLVPRVIVLPLAFLCVRGLPRLDWLVPSMEQGGTPLPCRVASLAVLVASFSSARLLPFPVSL